MPMPSIVNMHKTSENRENQQLIPD
jgi:hypothetical protein